MFWEGSNGTFAIATGGSAIQTIVTEAALENTPNPTLIRVRGEVIVMVTAIGAANAKAICSLGLIIQSNAAIAAGAGAMPQPNADVGSDFLWHRMVPLHVDNAIDTEGKLGTQASRFEIDNKAMRKFGLNQGLVLNVQNTVLVSTMSFEVTFAMRLLFKV